MKIIDRSRVRAPSCLKQLTVWVEDRDEIQFAIDQLDAYRAPWQLKEDAGRLAVFVPGSNDRSPVDTPRQPARRRKRP